MASIQDNRKRSAARNAAVGFLSVTVTILIGFVVQRVFIDNLGTSYLGLNNTLNSIIAVLTVADLGIGASVTFYLYKAFVLNDKKRIAILTNFYKKICYIVAGIILAGGAVIGMFIPNLLGDTSMIDANIFIIFGLCIINALMSYLMTYKQILLAADKKNYILSGIGTGYVVVTNVVRIALLILTQNYYLYLIVEIVMKLLRNIVLNQIIKRMYPYIKKISDAKLPKELRGDIVKRTRASFYHQSAGYIVFGTDNIIISNMFSLSIAGLYSSYFMILSALNSLFGQLFGAITGDLGHYLVLEKKENIYIQTKRIIWLNSVIGGLSAIMFYSLVQPFIMLWLGEDFLLGTIVVATLAISFYLNIVRSGLQALMSAAGVVIENRHMPIIEMIVKLVVSIVLAMWLGLVGVFLGTIVSTLVLHFFSYPKYMFELILDKKGTEYIRLFVKYLAMFLVIGCGVSLGLIVINDIVGGSNLLTLGINFVVSLGAGAGAYWLALGRTEEFKYFWNDTKSIIRCVIRRRA